MSTLLCVPIMVENADLARAEAMLAGEDGADLVEYRVDQFFGGAGDEDAVLRLVEHSPLPCIVTCRPSWEGGLYDGEEEDRVGLLERLGASASPPAYVDAELAAYTRSAEDRGAIDRAVDYPERSRDVRSRLILSTHDFEGRPADLTRRLVSMEGEDAAAVRKVAFRARSLRDNLELFDILAERSKPTIALGMGEFGLMSRVLAPKFGGFLTFASLREQAATAPGQPTLDELIGRYRFRSIGPGTRVYGIVGWPVGHSMSPLIHNAGFEEVGHDGVYLPLPIATGEDGAGGYESFKATMLELVHHPRLDFAGCSVTMPHKENLVRLAREEGWSLDEVSAGSGAANTLVVSRGGGGAFEAAEVHNTDAAAAIGCLSGELGGVGGRRVVVLGAGGVARAIAFGLAASGAEVVIANRSADRGAQLVRDIESAFAGRARKVAWDDRAVQDPDAYINCTSVGMAGGPVPDDSPLPGQAFDRGNKTLLETVYNPVRTTLLSQARDAGWRTIDGVSMFVDQGVRQFQLWTSRPAPRDRFDRLVRDALSG